MKEAIARRVRGKHALITGGSYGIGFALAERLVMNGASVTLIARDADKLASAQARLRQRVHRAHVRTLALDVSSSDAPHVIGRELMLKPVDFLFNNAGISRPGYFWEIPEDEFERHTQINFNGAVNVTRAALPSLLRSNDPHIVNVGSVSSVVASLGHSAYCGSKFALYGFSETLRAELRSRGVRVSIALPPETDTPMLANELPHLPPGAKRLQRSGGLLSADEVALAILRGMNR
jgi:3-dehydrosphinganine reductase